MNYQEQKQHSSTKPLLLAKLQKNRYAFDILMLLFMSFVLLGGIWWIITLYGTLTDAARYQCYAISFTQGVSALEELPPSQCIFMSSTESTILTQAAILQDLKSWHLPAWMINFVSSQSQTQPWHTLPYEYPFLSLLPFLAGLIGPLQWYQIIFALWMILLAIGFYFVVKRFVSRRTAIAFGLFLTTAGLVTVGGRFDLIPALCTFVAWICAQGSKWKWAFVLLALGTLFKIYPAVLILPFFVAQQKRSMERWYSWRRLEGLAIFTGICLGIEVVSLLFSVQDTLAPLSYFALRPDQIESFSACLLWMASFFHVPQTYIDSYGSLNVLSPLSPLVSALCMLGLVIGLGATFYLQWRGKLSLAQSVFLTLLIIIITGKVFSPQYLIWLAPFAAIVYQSSYKRFFYWESVCLLTMLIYPGIYFYVHNLSAVPLLPIFYPLVSVRNLLILGAVVGLLRQASSAQLEDGNEQESVAQGYHSVNPG